ncbi:antibiotic biosynthesis monooxygenase family protein [Streptomyces sp. NPDC057545]|uniref:antibiotic biosynthesis monooxygenase family protein n=1 Tax=Streptomyces sp. NPDC057545 TaxID=3346164 RepID=UPI0036BE3570
MNGPSEKQEKPVFHFINRFTVTGDPAEFERILGEINAHMSAQPGFRRHRLYRSAKDPQIYVETAEWDSAELHRKAIGTDAFRAGVKKVMAHATAEPAPFTVVRENGTGAP